MSADRLWVTDLTVNRNVRDMRPLPLAIGRFERVTDVPPLADDEIHVWLLVIPGTPTPREVATASRAFLERKLMHYAKLDRVPEIARGEHGKPYAPALPDLNFNLSHARDHVLVAFARGQPLGVDIERIDRKLALEDLARRFFAAEEADALDRIDVAERLPAFLRIWTCKEAVLKAIGQGLSFGLDRVVFTLGTGGVPAGLRHLADEAGVPEDWQIALMEPADGFVGALAWNGTPRRIRAFLADIDA